MEYKIISWPAIYTHIPQETIIQGVVRQHLGAFPPSFFKTKWLNNNRNIQNIYKNKAFLSDIKLPSVTVSYEIIDNPKETLSETDFPYTYGSHYIAGPLKTFYWKVYHDRLNNIEIYVAFIRKRIKLTFQYTFQDIYLRDDVYTWMLNSFRYEGPPVNFESSMSIYSALPTTMIEYISMMLSYDLSNKNDKKQFYSELFYYSGGLFRNRKVSMREVTSMWFLIYNLPKMSIIQATRPEKGEGELRGQTRTRFAIVEFLEFEPNFPQMFITNLPNIIKGKKIPNTYKPATFSPSSIDSRLYNTRNMIIDASLSIKRDFPLFDLKLSDTEFGVNESGEREVIPIDEEIFAKSHLEIINILKKQTLYAIDEYYKIALCAFNTILKKGVDYDYDWNDMVIIIYHANVHYTYRLLGLGNMKMLMPYFENYDRYMKKKVKETIDDANSRGNN